MGLNVHPKCPVSSPRVGHHASERRAAFRRVGGRSRHHDHNFAGTQKASASSKISSSSPRGSWTRPTACFSSQEPGYQAKTLSASVLEFVRKHSWHSNVRRLLQRPHASRGDDRRHIPTAATSPTPLPSCLARPLRLAGTSTSRGLFPPVEAGNNRAGVLPRSLHVLSSQRAVRSDQFKYVEYSSSRRFVEMPFPIPPLKLQRTSAAQRRRLYVVLERRRR